MNTQEERILSLLKNEPDLTIKQIAEKLKINRITASTYLRILEALEKVQHQQVGRGSLWSLKK